MTKGKTQSEETEQVQEPGSDTAEMLELSDWEFKTNVINMFRALMEAMDNVHG